MNKITKAIGYLLAATFQAFTLIVAGFMLGPILDEHFKKDSFSWLPVTVIVSIVCAAHIFYVLIKYIIKMDRED